jgi:DNA-binding CsgD family transcriptional regulator
MRPEECIESAERAARRLRGTRAPWLLADVLPIHMLDLVYLGRFAEAEDLGAELKPLTERLGHSAAAFTMRRADFLRQAAQTADLDVLDQLSMASWRMARATGSRFYLASATFMRGMVAFWRGEWASEARPLLREAARLSIPGFTLGGHHAVLCLLLAFEGNAAAAFAVLDQVNEGLPRPGRVNSIGQWSLAIYGAEAAGMLMDRSRARQLYPLVVEALGSGTLLRAYDAGLIQRAAGMAAAAAGLDEEAEQHFVEALRQAEELPQLMERAAVRHFYARFLVDRGGSGDVERAGSFLEEAAAAFSSIGMPKHLELVTVQRSRLGERRTEAAQVLGKARYPDSLTAREVEILGLLAAGLTSAELAAQLCLSVATVQRHIANIYGKTGVRNRVEVALYAVRHQLADPDRT